MRRALWLAAILGFAACAQAEPPLDPAAATLAFFHADPSVPPPYHREWRLTIRPDHIATYQRWRGYPGPAVTPLEYTFVVPQAQYDALVAALRDAPLSDAARPRLIMPGSDTNEITLAAASRTVAVRPNDAAQPERWKPAVDVFDAIASGADAWLERGRINPPQP